MEAEQKRKMIDPPSGWKYGFPKEIPKGVSGDGIKKWLVDNGYPKSEIDSYGDYFMCRFWFEPINKK